MTPEALRGLAAKIRRDAESAHFGDPRYSVVISSDKADALTAAIPELLAQVTDLERRLSIAAELTIGDRQQIRALETRQQDLVALTAHLNNEVLFPNEDWTTQRTALITEIGTLRATVAEALRFTRHQAIEIDLLSKWWGEAKDGCAERDLRIHALETRVTAIAALLRADPLQTVDADLSTIENTIANVVGQHVEEP